MTYGSILDWLTQRYTFTISITTEEMIGVGCLLLFLFAGIVFVISVWMRKIIRTAMNTAKWSELKCDAAKNELEAVKRHIDKRDEVNVELRKEIEALTASLASAAEELNAVVQARDALETKVEHLELARNPTELEEQLHNVRRSHDEQSTIIADLRRQLSGKDKEIASLRETMQQEVQIRDDKLKHREQLITDIRAAYANQDKVLQSANAECGAQQALVKELKRQNEELLRNNHELKADLGSSRGINRDLSTKQERNLDRLRKKLHAGSVLISKKNEEIYNLRREIDQQRVSVSTTGQELEKTVRDLRAFTDEQSRLIGLKNTQIGQLKEGLLTVKERADKVEESIAPLKERLDRLEKDCMTLHEENRILRQQSDFLQAAKDSEKSVSDTLRRIIKRKNDEISMLLKAGGADVKLSNEVKEMFEKERAAYTDAAVEGKDTVQSLKDEITRLKGMLEHNSKRVPRRAAQILADRIWQSIQDSGVVKNCKITLPLDQTGIPWSDIAEAHKKEQEQIHEESNQKAREEVMSKRRIQAVSEAIIGQYTVGECPDCGEAIPRDVAEGQACVNCGHTFTLPQLNPIEKLAAQAIFEEYDGVCPDCGRVIPIDVQDGDSCVSCDYQFILSVEAESKIIFDFNDGVCPSCSSPLPPYVSVGDKCSECGYVFQMPVFEPSPADPKPTDVERVVSAAVKDLKTQSPTGRNEAKLETRRPNVQHTNAVFPQSQASIDYAALEVRVAKSVVQESEKRKKRIAELHKFFDDTTQHGQDVSKYRQELDDLLKEEAAANAYECPDCGQTITSGQGCAVCWSGVATAKPVPLSGAQSGAQLNQHPASKAYREETAAFVRELEASAVGAGNAVFTAADLAQAGRNMTKEDVENQWKALRKQFDAAFAKWNGNPHSSDFEAVSRMQDELTQLEAVLKQKETKAALAADRAEAAINEVKCPQCSLVAPDNVCAGDECQGFGCSYVFTVAYINEQRSKVAQKGEVTPVGPRRYEGKAKVLLHEIEFWFSVPAEIQLDAELEEALSDEAKDRASAMIVDGYGSGELNYLYAATNTEIRGWWTITTEAEAQVADVVPH